MQYESLRIVPEHEFEIARRRGHGLSRHWRHVRELDEELPVGMAMVDDAPERTAYDRANFMTSAGAQRIVACKEGPQF